MRPALLELVAWLVVARRTARQNTPLERGRRNVLRWQIALSLVALLRAGRLARPQ